MNAAQRKCKHLAVQKSEKEAESCAVQCSAARRVLALTPNVLCGVPDSDKRRGPVNKEPTHSKRLAQKKGSGKHWQVNEYEICEIKRGKRVNSTSRFFHQPRQSHE